MSIVNHIPFYVKSLSISYDIREYTILIKLSSVLTINLCFICVIGLPFTDPVLPLSIALL